MSQQLLIAVLHGSKEVKANAHKLDAFVEALCQEIGQAVISGKGKGLPSPGPLDHGLEGLLRFSAQTGLWIGVVVRDKQVVGVMFDFWDMNAVLHVPCFHLLSVQVEPAVWHRLAAEMAANHRGSIRTILQEQRAVFGINLNVCAEDAQLFLPLPNSTPTPTRLERWWKDFKRGMGR
jgi:hypothetical protein